MARTNTIDYGIDLGTTTSCIVKFHGKDDRKTAIVIPNSTNDSMNYTPSAVYLQMRNGTELIHVGKKAKENTLIHPFDAFAEFKLRMGDTNPYHFQAANKDMLAEELAAEVLKSLKMDAREIYGEELSSIVITVPADFNQPKIQATERASKIAGFKECHIIKEPYAAALAYAQKSSKENETDDGYWMIYDLGGGTFDVAIVSKFENNFEIISNEGDESLGGKLIDWDIVDKIFVPAIVNKYGLSNFNRNNMLYRKQFAKLKLAAEEAKIHLSKNSAYYVELDDFLLTDDGDWIDFEYDITIAELKEIMKPYINRSINSCHAALNKADLSASDINKLILVGGSTKSQIIKESLTKEFNIPLDSSIDPITVVARGAAIAAGNIIKSFEDVVLSNNEYFIKLDYETMGTADEFSVVYEVVAPEGETLDGCYIEFKSKKSGFDSGKISLNNNVGYVDLVAYEENGINLYNIELTNSEGQLLKISPESPDSVEYIISVNALEPTLLKDVGLGLADNSLFYFAREGGILPFKDTVVFYTEDTLEKGLENFLELPLYEGNKPKADKNTLIGKLKISGKDIPRNLPQNSEVEITINIDKSNIIEFSAEIPIFDLMLEQDAITIGNVYVSSISELKEKFEYEKDRFYDLQQRYVSAPNVDVADENFNKIINENMINDIESLINAAESDRDSQTSAEKRIKEFGYSLDEINDVISKEEKINDLREDIESLIENVDPLVQKSEDLKQQIYFKKFKEDYDEAINKQDIETLESIKDVLIDLLLELNVDIYITIFNDYKNNGVYTKNQLQADSLIKRGERVIENRYVSNDFVNELVLKVINPLSSLDERRKSEDSVQKRNIGVITRK
ncbi:Hsp70 family protein [uncultured Methanobrevibacter sp.]|uniref:Hsp70 family protein n=1 Tax=uncultured Methanobrevibacter sp. TaxID=253161 RepID=UPI0025CCD4DA|nr:Hsp70 family protein [uncultured Methanobrevibacter sp.]